jgi:two-component sensor histidine kinase
MTNALKYATKPGDHPRIAVALTPTAQGGYRLEVSNDAPEIGPGRGDAIGERLMAGFARQLRATLTANREDGRYLVRLDVPGRSEPGRLAAE